MHIHIEGILIALLVFSALLHLVFGFMAYIILYRLTRPEKETLDYTPQEESIEDYFDTAVLDFEEGAFV